MINICLKNVSLLFNMLIIQTNVNHCQTKFVSKSITNSLAYIFFCLFMKIAFFGTSKGVATKREWSCLFPTLQELGKKQNSSSKT